MKKILERIKNSKKIVIDIETTGLDRYNDEILQLSIINGNGKELYNNYIRPVHHTSWNDAMAIHGITPEMLKDKNTFEQELPKIERIIKKANLIIGYNHIYFDIPFLKNQIKKVRKGKSDLFKNKELYDVMLKFAEYYGEYDEVHDSFKWKKLTFSAAYFGYRFKAHDSLEDVRATLFVYNKLSKLSK